VVNNPILIVDEMLYRVREEQADSRRAVREAVDSRLRPILMSTITTVVGLAPLVLLPGAGAELYRGLGAIVLFGLLFAMLVTLFFLPPLLVTVLEVGARVTGTLASLRERRRGNADTAAAMRSLSAGADPGASASSQRSAKR
jgi:Cu/Ag efflux pump CusA